VAEDCLLPARFFVSSGPAIPEKQLSEKKERKNHESTDSSKKRNCSIFVALTCFGLSPVAQAQLNLPPDGGYPGFNTTEGDDALFNLTIGIQNTAIGFNALFPGRLIRSALQFNTTETYDVSNSGMCCCRHLSGYYR
jgi:hypothetical protein